MEQNTPAEDFEKQGLTEHLRELRSCLIVSFVAVFVGFCLSYTVIRPIGTWFFKPLTDVLPQGSSLIFTSYQEGFFLSKARPGRRHSAGLSGDFLADLAFCSARSLQA
jgi:Sec-independent protein secretion pathway component TatC